MFKTILLCSDGSEHALKAAEACVELAQKFDSRILLINVFNPAITSVPLFGGPEAAPLAEATVRYGEELQAAVERRTGTVFEAAGVAYEKIRELGHPVDRIVAVAEAEKADLIVMGSRGLGRFQRFFLGSVTDGVLRHAPCPVLIVR